MEKIKLGKIVSVVGLKGELKVYPLCDYKERFEELDRIWVRDGWREILKVRYQKGMAILTLSGISDRTTADQFREEFLFIDKKDVRKLPEDTYYIFDLIGLTVVDEEDAVLGKVSDVIQNPSQDLYEVEEPSGNKFLIPAVSEFILSCDLEHGIMKVKLIEGLR